MHSKDTEDASGEQQTDYVMCSPADWCVFLSTLRSRAAAWLSTLLNHALGWEQKKGEATRWVGKSHGCQSQSTVERHVWSLMRIQPQLIYLDKWQRKEWRLCWGILAIRYSNGDIYLKAANKKGSLASEPACLHLPLCLTNVSSVYFEKHFRWYWFS